MEVGGGSHAWRVWRWFTWMEVVHMNGRSGLIIFQEYQFVDAQAIIIV